MLSKRERPGGRIVAFWLAVAAATLPVALASEPIVVINTSQPSGNAAEPAPPTAPHIDWPVATADVAPASPGIEAAGTDGSSSDRSPPVIALAPKPPPVWATAPERSHTGVGLTSITRYNRKGPQARTDPSVPIIPAISAAAANPAFNLIECVAGCIGARGTVVYFAPRLSSQTDRPVEPAGVQSAVLTLPAPAAANTITCIAGCYSTPKSYASRYPLAPPHGAAADALPAASLIATAASMDEPGPVSARVRARGPKIRFAAFRAAKPRSWHTTTLLRQERLMPRRAWSTSVVRF